jgi:phosphatidylserine/phosphatidylglycerophosphate/cardiolipin synthase-like enzyme
VKDPLLSLAPSELRALASSVRNGRVSAPYSALGLQQIVGQHAAWAVSNKLDLLSASGMSSEALSVCLELTADALSSRLPLEDLVDLVTTGPEAGGVANRSTAVVVSELFRGAERSVLVAGYAVYQGQKVFQALGDRMVQRPELDVRMFLDLPRKKGDTSTADALVARFAQQFKSSKWPNAMPLPHVYCCEHLMGSNGKPGSLHAKCIVVDGKYVFVSSANFTEAAQERNIEVGLLVQSPTLADRIRVFFDALLDVRFFIRTI